VSAGTILLNVELISAGVCAIFAMPFMVFRVNQNGAVRYVLSAIFFLLTILAIIAPLAGYFLEDISQPLSAITMSLILCVCVEGIEKRQKTQNPGLIIFIFPLMIWFVMIPLLLIVHVLGAIVHSIF